MNILRRKGKLVTILLFCFFLSACSIENINNKITDLDSGIDEELVRLESGNVSSEIMSQATSTMEENHNQGSNKSIANVTEDLKTKIDNWIKENNLNRYGDVIGTAYAGGTPLFDEATGKAIERYDYIINNHPDLKDIINN